MVVYIHMRLYYQNGKESIRGKQQTWTTPWWRVAKVSVYLGWNMDFLTVPGVVQNTPVQDQLWFQSQILSEEELHVSTNGRLGWTANEVTPSWWALNSLTGSIVGLVRTRIDPLEVPIITHCFRAINLPNISSEHSSSSAAAQFSYFPVLSFVCQFQM
jgi:hypothetical protein